jgi:hypothetical protein
MDIIKFIDGMLPWLKKEVNSLLSPLENRLSTLEKREALPGKDGANGRDGVDGKDVDIEFIKTAIFLEVAKLPLAKDGKDGIDGKDGKDADPEYIKSVIAEEISKVPAAKDGKDADIDQVKALVAEEVAKIPAPKDGKDADISEIKAIIQAEVAAIPKATDGKDADLEQIEKLVADAVAKIPTPQNGEPGPQGIQGVEGKSFTADEAKIILKELHESESARWALDFERRANDLIQRTIDRIEKPKDGRDGMDGLGFEDLRVEHDGRRTATLIFEKDGQRKEFTLNIPAIIDIGFWKEGVVAEAGDGVTHGGSFWIAQKDTESKPEQGNPDWRLAVRKGRDARQAKLDK